MPGRCTVGSPRVDYPPADREEPLIPYRTALRLRKGITQIPCNAGRQRAMRPPVSSLRSYAGRQQERRSRTIDKIVFCDSDLTRNGLFFLVKKWGELARISESRCSPHTFRHFFATQYLRNGGNILSLQRILGHSRLDITERYPNYAQSDVKAEHERYSPALQFLR